MQKSFDHLFTLSKGQARVREIVKELLKIYPSTDFTDEYDRGHPAYDKMFDLFSKDQTIKSDIYTGTTLGCFHPSDNYLSKLLEGTNETSNLDLSSFDFNKMVFNGRLYGNGRHADTLALTGGNSNPGAVANAIFKLCSGKEVNGREVRFHYYVNNGILDIVNGNHRMLSFKLTGFLPERLNNAIIHIYENDRILPLT